MTNVQRTTDLKMAQVQRSIKMLHHTNFLLENSKVTTDPTAGQEMSLCPAIKREYASILNKVCLSVPSWLGMTLNYEKHETGSLYH